jgi:N-acyl-phosphatidylethanolamine-hydrolysing phospholipase D
VALSIAVLLVWGCTPPPEPELDRTLGTIASLRAPHGSPQEGFFNPWVSDPKTLWGVLRWWVFTSNPHDKSRAPVVASIPNDGAGLSGREDSASLTWVGHATFAVHDGPDVFLTDPHFGPRALVPARLSPPGIPIASVPPDSFAVISHNHYDHLDAYTVDELPESVHWYVPSGMGDWFRERGRPNVTELDWWESAQHGRFSVTCLPSQHWSRRIEVGLNESLWCAWLVDSGETRYFFAGDTGYFHGFQEYGREFGPIDVAMLPIGAYEPRWFMKYQHMDPAEAYQAFLDLDARFMAAMHWGTFDLTDEPMDLPPKVLRQVVADREGDAERVRIFAIGERWRVPEDGRRIESPDVETLGDPAGIR